jgi:cysteine desulfurase family protein (TIGR01976 family)
MSARNELPALDVEFCRAQFPQLKNGCAYMENAGGSYVPTSVINAMTTFLTTSKNQSHSGFASGRLAGERLEGVQAGLARMMNADRDELVVGPSTSLNTFILAQGLRHIFGPGDELIVTEQDHEANSGVWRRLDEFGVVVREWCVDPKTGLLGLNDLRQMVSAKTKLICYPHVSNIFAAVNPVADISRIARQVGAMTVVDGVAFVGHAAIDVKAWDVDFYLYSLYKVYGPHLGVMYAKRESAAKAQNQNHYFKDGDVPETLHPGGNQYEALASAAGVIEYIDGLYDHHFTTPEADLHRRTTQVFALFAAQEQACCQRLIDYLASKPSVCILGPATGDRDVRMPTLCFTVAGQSSRDIAIAAGEQGIAMAAGNFYSPRCLQAIGIPDIDDGAARLSLLHYNSLEEVDRVIQTLDAIIA